MNSPATLTTAGPPAEPLEDGFGVPAPSRARLVAGALISLVSVAGCVWWALQQEAPQFPDTVAGVVLVILGAVIYGVATLARGWRWHVILKRASVAHQRADAFGLTIVGYMGNAVLPARGGELLRIFLMSERSSARKREVLGSILPERLLDAAALVVLFLGLTLWADERAPTGAGPAIAAAGALAVAFAALVFYLRLRQAGKMESFAERVRPVARASRLLLTPAGFGLFLFTIVIWLSEGLIFWMIAESLELNISLAEAALTVVVASFFGMIPAAPGYVGTYDAAVLFALHRLDVPAGPAIGVALLFRLAVFAPVTATGLVLMVTRYGGLRAALRRERSALDADADVARAA